MYALVIANGGLSDHMVYEDDESQAISRAMDL